MQRQPVINVLLPSGLTCGMWLTVSGTDDDSAIRMSELLSWDVYSIDLDARATNLYQDGSELELISRILWHSSTELRGSMSLLP
ncbi:hypothetical protein [Diplocloster agilis]|uniref:hypothetical protein n=1 Tax=Diplocloster agilis TaxID=2850323 RepID=UPI0022658410|nr:hypothetical protein [Suonthocola fibrivorans]MCU6733113.1 hypothetical protein [Suonthocola fibrivorans]